MRWIILPLCWCLVLASPVWATRTITVTHTYILGDADSKTQARSACLLEARRRILEQAGAFTQASSEMRDFVLTQDVVRTFAGAFVKTTLVSEEMGLSGQSPTLTCTVAGEVDTAELERLREEFARTLLEQAKRMDLDSAAGQSAGQGAGQGAGQSSSPPLPKGLPKSLPDTPPAAVLQEKFQQKAEIQRQNKEEAFLAAWLPEKGMTSSQVEQLLGQPQAGVDGPAYQCRDHGGAWVVYKQGRVSCIRRSLSWSAPQESDCHCDGFGGDFHLR